MPNFTAGTSFGANDTVTNTKLNALIADAVINPECALSINSGTIGTLSCTRGTIGTFNSTTGTVATLNTTTGSVQTLSAGTLATNLTGGTYSGLINSSTGTFSGLINSSTGTYSGLINSSTGTFTGSIGGSANLTSGTIQTLTASTLTGTLTGGTYSGSIGTARSFTAGTINNFTSSSNATISGVTVGTGNPSGSQQNVAVGISALTSNTSGDNNSAFGRFVLNSNTTGSYNYAFGNFSLNGNTSGRENSAFGASVLSGNTTGSYNTAFGNLSLNTSTTSTANVAVGYQALFATSGSGSLNTAIGYVAGNSNTTGSNNSFIGNSAQGASASANNAITLGNGSIATLRCQVQSITSLSDRRDKSEVKDLSAGLDFVGKLRPVSFVWNTRDKAKVNVLDSGFIAQELIEAQEKTGIVIPNLVSQENPEKLEAAYGTLIPVLVQAIKELKAKVELLESKK
jgi:hypothetical protein